MQERLEMVVIREVYRLKYEKGLSMREIGCSCGCGRQTVANYISLAEKAGVNWAEDKKLNDRELEDKLYKNRRKEKKVPGRLLPDFEYIHNELKKKDVTKQLLWAEYKQQYPEDGYQYEMFCLLYRRWKEKLRIYMRQNHKAGEKLFIDYDDGIPIIDLATGKKIPTDIFVCVWGASNYTYAEATYSQSLENWIMSHVRAFEEFGCIPEICVPDNLKSGVNKPCRYEPLINRTYYEMARYYGTVIMPARSRKPQDKAKVEVGVQIVGRWILASLRNRKFYSLAELNHAIKELLVKLNDRPMVKIKKSRKEMFETLDKPAALPLIVKPYEYAQWKRSKVNIDYHIEAHEHYYSVDYNLRKERVDVRVTDKIVEIFYNNTRHTSHVRSYVKWGHTTKKEHMPVEHQKYLEWTPSRMISWAEKTGPNAVEVVKHILESRKYPQQGYKSCLGIIRSGDHYGKERLENACKRAVRYRTYSYQSIKSILACGLDKQSDLFNNNTAGSKMPKHDNIRGEGYYNDGVSNH